MWQMNRLEVFRWYYLWNFFSGKISNFACLYRNNNICLKLNGTLKSCKTIFVDIKYWKIGSKEKVFSSMLRECYTNQTFLLPSNYFKAYLMPFCQNWSDDAHDNKLLLWDQHFEITFVFIFLMWCWQFVYLPLGHFLINILLSYHAFYTNAIFYIKLTCT